MPDYAAQVLVCTNTENAEDRRHCGDKGGREVRQMFNELLVKHQLLDKVTVSNVGCTSQHKFCNGAQGNVIVYGPRHELGGPGTRLRPMTSRRSSPSTSSTDASSSEFETPRGLSTSPSLAEQGPFIANGMRVLLFERTRKV